MREETEKDNMGILTYIIAASSCLQFEPPGNASPLLGLTPLSYTVKEVPTKLALHKINFNH